MLAAVVAGITNARHAHLEQLRIVAAMRLVAVRTVFHNRRVFPDERPTALGVAAQAVFVGGALDELRGIGRPMRIVTTSAGNLPFAIRHVRGALQLRPPHLVALQAQLRLRFFNTAIFRKRRVEASLGRKRRVQFLLHLMAVHASHAPGFMRAALPEHVVPALMACFAGGILLSYRIR